MSSDICTDNRFELIEKYKKKLIEATNIEDSPKEMEVIDNILFRMWQMDWLDKLERQIEPTMYGYSLEELLAFSECCRKQGITKEELHDFCLNLSIAYQIVREQFVEYQEKFIRGLIHGED